MWMISCLRCILLIYGISVLDNVSGKSWTKTFFLKTIEHANSTDNDNSLRNGNDKRDNTLNPVLQNFTSLFEYLNAARRNSHKVKSYRKKRQSRQRNCAGQCEDSLCSWHEEYDEESTRIPRFIKYAVCDSATCNFGFGGLDFRTTYSLQVRTQCDLVKTDILVTNIGDGEQRWLTNWPIACVCAERFAVSSEVYGHDSGLSQHAVDVDISHNEPIAPVSRQQIILNDVRRRPLTHSQRRRLHNQQRHTQHVETWEHMMLRKYNRIFK
ncbi:uncharacterized protein LOC132738182 isoform X2 [Ruditapes philippinarum]|uniref:uncharacterized protein LOC132738182 isoform X2 n=1 Tax=Ruditapes philippinarum TaxID=129788 RepID=UPI00295BC71A|nr:uncharacterized protein LOC132738182 isoform X2 [Ruditapes philippinarum]